MSWPEAFAGRYEEWSAHMTEDVSLLVEYFDADSRGELAGGADHVRPRHANSAQAFGTVRGG